MQRGRNRVQIVVKQVRVGVQRDFGRLVSKHPLQRKHIDPGTDRETRAGVAQIMRSDRLRARSLDRPPEPPVRRLRTRTSGRVAIPGAVSRKAHPPNQPKPNPAKLDPLQLEKRDHALGLGLRLGERRHRGGDFGQHLLALAGR
jgi:hypothetical protein